jgi:hypothetical protein
LNRGTPAQPYKDHLRKIFSCFGLAQMNSTGDYRPPLAKIDSKAGCVYESMVGSLCFRWLGGKTRARPSPPDSRARRSAGGASQNSGERRRGRERAVKELPSLDRVGTVFIVASPNLHRVKLAADRRGLRPPPMQPADPAHFPSFAHEAGSTPLARGLANRSKSVQRLYQLCRCVDRAPVPG